MDDLREYLLSVIGAVMICAIITRFVNGSDTLRTLTKLLCGLFIVYTAIKPLPIINLSGISAITSRYSVEAQTSAQLGIDMSSDVLRQSIKEQTQAYILDKAKTLKADLQVEVELSEDDIPVPMRVSIIGKVSPNAKKQLTAMIEKDLGINMEYQRWN